MRIDLLTLKARRAEEFLQTACANGDGLALIQGDPFCSLAADRRKLSLQTAHTGLARIERDDLPDRSVADAQLRAG